MGCTYESHDEIRADRARFDALPFHAIQTDDDGRPELVYRTCACGSHLCREVFPHAEIEAALLTEADHATETR